MVSGRDQTFFREAPFAAERSGAGDLRSSFCGGAKRSWRLAKHLLLRSEAELETCEAPFTAERSGAGDLRSSFCCGAKRSWRLAKHLLLRSEAELETCEAPFWTGLGGFWAVLGAKS